MSKYRAEYVISPVGVSNSLTSSLINNRADFGPDTSGTATSGIQEAVRALSIGNRGNDKQELDTITYQILKHPDPSLSQGTKTLLLIGIITLLCFAFAALLVLFIQAQIPTYYSPLFSNNTLEELAFTCSNHTILAALVSDHGIATYQNKSTIELSEVNFNSTQTITLLTKLGATTNGQC